MNPIRHKRKYNTGFDVNIEGRKSIGMLLRRNGPVGEFSYEVHYFEVELKLKCFSEILK